MRSLNILRCSHAAYNFFHVFTIFGREKESPLCQGQRKNRMQAELTQDIVSLLDSLTGRLSGYGDVPTLSLLTYDAQRGSYEHTHKFCCRFRALLKEAFYQDCVAVTRGTSTINVDKLHRQLKARLLSYFINMILDVDKLPVDTTDPTDWKGKITNECMKVFLDILSTHSYDENHEHNPLSGAGMVSELPSIFGTTSSSNIGTN